MTKQSERIYGKLMNKIGIAMLINQLLFHLLGSGYSMLERLLSAQREAYTSVDAMLLTVKCAVYIVSFVLPVVIFNKLNKNADREIYEPIDMGGGASTKQMLVMLFIGLGLTKAFSYINYFIVNVFFDYSEFTEEAFWQVELDHPYQILIYFVYVAIIPAVVEELLFRGAVCKALRVYGKETAIIVSAVLFALMHTNIEQLLYTFVAGACLGWIYVETGSLRYPMLLHFINNGLSVITKIVYEKCSPAIYNKLNFFFDDVVYGAMAVCLVIYLIDVLKQGEFIKPLKLKPDENGEEVLPLSVGERVRGFFSVGNILFVMYSVTIMGFYLYLSTLKR